MVLVLTGYLTQSWILNLFSIAFPPKQIKQVFSLRISYQKKIEKKQQQKKQIKSKPLINEVNLFHANVAINFTVFHCPETFTTEYCWKALI